VLLVAERVKMLPPPSSRFAPGNRAAVGNRGPEAKAQIRRGRAALLSLLNCVDKDGTGNWHKLWQRLFDRALAGDTKSAKLVLEYSLGAPKQSVDVHPREYGDTIPALHEGMTLTEMARIYAQSLQGRRRSGDGDHEVEVIPASRRLGSLADE
jgi:hypothetical protein